jgi:hypothetical protein
MNPYHAVYHYLAAENSDENGLLEGSFRRISMNGRAGLQAEPIHSPIRPISACISSTLRHQTTKVLRSVFGNLNSRLEINRSRSGSRLFAVDDRQDAPQKRKGTRATGTEEKMWGSPLSQNRRKKAIQPANSKRRVNKIIKE